MRLSPSSLTNPIAAVRNVKSVAARRLCRRFNRGAAGVCRTFKTIAAMSSCRRPSAEKIALVKEKIERFIGGFVSALIPDFAELAPTQVVTLLVPHFVQAVGGKKLCVAGRQVAAMNFVRYVAKRAGREATFAERLATGGGNAARRRFSFQSGRTFPRRNAAQARVTNHI